MDSEFLLRHWGPLAALLLFAAVGLQLSLLRIRRSPSAQLRRALAQLQDQRRIAGRARAATEKAEARLDRLLKQKDRIRPSLLQEARDAQEDARSLQKIAHDKLLIAENHVRRIIHEEFPPVKQGKLRARYLPEGGRDPRPFSF